MTKKGMISAEEIAKRLYRDVPLMRKRGIMELVKWVGWSMKHGFCIVIAE